MRITYKRMPSLEIDECSGVELVFLTGVIEKMDTLGIIERDLSACVLEVIGVDSESMREINFTHRGKDSTTDVLSFPLDVEFAGVVSENSGSELNGELKPCLGSVIINTELAGCVAKKLEHSLNDEITLLFIHGLLHILGYDHEVDNGEQRAMEQMIVESLGLGRGLIVREMGE